MNTFICYAKCGTCRKAKKWLDDNGITYGIRWINEDNPKEEELTEWVMKTGKDVRKFFNTSGQLYKSMGLKDKLKTMSDEEMIKLLSTDGMLVKRPIFLFGDDVLVGFKTEEWAVKLLN